MSANANYCGTVLLLRQLVRDGYGSVSFFINDITIARLSCNNAMTRTVSSGFEISYTWLRIIGMNFNLFSYVL